MAESIGDVLQTVYESDDPLLRSLPNFQGQKLAA